MWEVSWPPNFMMGVLLYLLSKGSAKANHMGGKITMQARKRKILYPAQWLIPPRSSHQQLYILFVFSQHLGEVK